MSEELQNHQAMNYELIYTSAPKGLKPGSSGYCTVAATEGIPSALVDQLELLSGLPPLQDRSLNHPVSLAHWRVRIAGRTRSVLSRVAAVGLDYTRRPNKLAYHLVLDPGEHPEQGPAWAISQPGMMLENWSGAPAFLKPRKLPSASASPETCVSCQQWEAATGDAGWGGILGENFMVDSLKPAYLIRTPEIDPLPFLQESIRLMPARLRWQVTFNTYFNEVPAGLSCAWRCVMADTPAAESARRSTATVIDLTHPVGRAPDTPGAVAARNGQSLPNTFPAVSSP
jgi:hypothetical protein